jgi:hypothetical protein
VVIYGLDLRQYSDSQKFQIFVYRNWFGFTVKKATIILDFTKKLNIREIVMPVAVLNLFVDPNHSLLTHLGLEIIQERKNLQLQVQCES